MPADVRTVHLGLSIAGAEVLASTLEDALAIIDHDEKETTIVEAIIGELKEQIDLRKRAPKKP